MKLIDPQETYRQIFSIKAPIECSKKINGLRDALGTVQLSDSAKLPDDFRRITYKNGFLFWWWGVSERGFFFDFCCSRSAVSKALNTWLKCERQQIN